MLYQNQNLWGRFFLILSLVLYQLVRAKMGHRGCFKGIDRARVLVLLFFLPVDALL